MSIPISAFIPGDPGGCTWSRSSAGARSGRRGSSYEVGCVMDGIGDPEVTVHFCGRFFWCGFEGEVDGRGFYGLVWGDRVVGWVGWVGDGTGEEGRRGGDS